MKNNNSFASLAVLSIIISLVFLSLAAGCAQRPRKAPEQIVLTEEQRKVKIIRHDPSTNRKLRKACDVIDVVPGAPIIQLRIYAAERGGNVVEVVQTGHSESTTTYQNRYYSTSNSSNQTYGASVIYKCPLDFSLQ